MVNKEVIIVAAFAQSCKKLITLYLEQMLNQSCIFCVAKWVMISELFTQSVEHIIDCYSLVNSFYYGIHTIRKFTQKAVARVKLQLYKRAGVGL